VRWSPSSLDSRRERPERWADLLKREPTRESTLLSVPWADVNAPDLLKREPTRELTSLEETEHESKAERRDRRADGSP